MLFYNHQWRWARIQIWTQFGKFSPPLAPHQLTLDSLLPMWVSFLSFKKPPASRCMSIEQAIAPTIVWGLLTGLASSRRRRSAGEMLRQCWSSQYVVVCAIVVCGEKNKDCLNWTFCGICLTNIHSIRPWRDSSSPRPLQPFWPLLPKQIRCRSRITVVSKHSHMSCY